MSLSAFCEKTSPDSKHASFIHGGAARMHECLLYKKLRPIEQKSLWKGCARIGMKDVLCPQFGAKK